MHYPSGTVRALLATDHVSPATRQALQHRLDTQPEPLHYFTADEADLLRQLAARLLPQPNNRAQIDLVSPVDQRLARNEADGWRYDVLPADPVAWRQGLLLFHEVAQAAFGLPFTQLDGRQQDTVIGQFQQGEASSATWQPLAQQRFFEELLAELASYYFSHPLAQEEFGYAGMADRPRWERIGLNEREEREPEER